MAKGDRKRHIDPFTDGPQRTIKVLNEVIARQNDHGDRIFDLEKKPSEFTAVTVVDGILRYAQVPGTIGDEVL